MITILVAMIIGGISGSGPACTAAVGGVMLAAIGLQVASLFQPWWWIKLYAPQYPKGLKIIISLTGVSGDAKEVDDHVYA